MMMMMMMILRPQTLCCTLAIDYSDPGCKAKLFHRLLLVIFQPNGSHLQEVRAASRAVASDASPRNTTIVCLSDSRYIDHPLRWSGIY